MRKCKIGDIANLCLGKMLDKEKNKGQYEPYLANANVQWGYFDLCNLPQMRFEEKEQKRYELKYGDIVMCEGGEPGRCAIWRNEIPGIKIQKALHRIRITDDNTDYRYLYYWFLIAGRQSLLKGNFIETTIKHLTGERLKDIEIELPSLLIQQKIGSFLECIDNKINNNNNIISTLESLSKTLYDYYFLQFDFPDEKGCPYKSSGGKMEYNAELGREIPAEWKVRKVKDILSVITGKKDANFATENGKFKFFTCSDDVLKCDTSSFEGHAVLLAGNGNFNVKHYTGKFNAYQRTYVLIPNDDYLYGILYLSVLQMVDTLTKHSTGSIVKFITKSDVENIHIIEQPNQKLYDRINILIRKTETLQEENEFLTALRDFLLPLLMNGQVGFKTPTSPNTKEAPHEP